MDLKWLFYILISVFSLAIIISFFLLTRKVILKIIEKTRGKYFNNLQTINNTNKTSLEHINIISASDKSMSEIKNKLETISTSLNNLFNKIDTNNEYLIERINKKKVLDSINTIFFIRKLYKDYQRIQSSFDIIFTPISKKWNKIDEDISVFLDKTLHIKNSLLTKKKTLKYSFLFLLNENNRIRSNIKPVRKNQYSGSFISANKEIQSINSELNDLIMKFNNIEKTEYFVFLYLPVSITTLKNYNDEEFYNYIHDKWKKLVSEFNHLSIFEIHDTVRKLCKEISEFKTLKFENVLLDNFLKNFENMFFALVNYLEKNKNNLIKNNIELLKNNFQHLKVKEFSNDDILEAISKIFNLFFSSIDNIEISELLKKFQKNYNKLKEAEVTKITSYFFFVIENKFLPETSDINEEVNKLSELYKMLVDSKFQLFYKDAKLKEQFIKTLTHLIKQIYQNEEYLEMYKELEFFAFKSKFIKNDSKLQDSMKVIDIYLKNQNYKKAFKTLKSIIKEYRS
ncbi:hypothetical protein MCANUFG1_00758 [Mycoplasmopsis canis UFG1]|uniref:hypothetical protein n=1 Tax=Mycoplasmopsis canis TaxID=29555 RepID=UPI00025B0D04|nr:hypothetical protein [Mycoplasmopsis canis]EIE41928.1 hypothetical protein MCANUFG1_00758 [Mycoplasmopsis canis UFG1]